MLLSPFPGVNWSSSSPSFESLPAYGRSWSVQRATYSSSRSTQQYLIFKSYIPRNTSSSPASDVIQSLTQDLINDSTISASEALSITARLEKSPSFPGHNLLAVQFHLEIGCSVCAVGGH
jgi:hypothetical protein